MANQLAIPFKKSSVIPIRDAVSNYIRANHPETHPEAFKWDIDRWEHLRADALADTIHISRVRALITYYNQLRYASTKLPNDIGLEISYTSALDTLVPSNTLPNLSYERVSVLFNLAALYSQLAISENRSHPDGIKRANAYYQNAAGTLNFLTTSALPELLQSLPHGVHIPELTEPPLRSLEYLMLAQAQECAWQKAVMDQLKNGIIAKLAAKVSALYEVAASTVRDSNVPHVLPKEWLAHIDTKALHFGAATQYRKSMEDLESNRYGHELARLTKARDVAKSGYDLARRNFVARPVLNDIKSVMDIIHTNLTRAERDNDLIYHYDVPAFSQLPPVQEVTMVKSTTPAELKDGYSIGTDAERDEMIFADLMEWGAKVAIDIYKERVNSWLKTEVFNKVQELDTAAERTLQVLNLPSLLDTFDAPSTSNIPQQSQGSGSLPARIRRKAAEVRAAGGSARIEGSFESLETLQRHCRAALDAAMDTLDQEASEDEGVRRRLASGTKDAGATLPPGRAPSYEANAKLTAAESRYRGMMDHAAESDALVREKWEAWEEAIERLTWDEDEIEQWVPAPVSLPTPSSTTSTESVSSPESGANETPARILARTVRSHLETLDELRTTRAEITSRACRVAAADDITPRIVREASTLSQAHARTHSQSNANASSNLTRTPEGPARFEGTLDEELNKYERFRGMVEAGAARQGQVLDALGVACDAFKRAWEAELMRERGEQEGKVDEGLEEGDGEEGDLGGREREYALQSLDLAYHKYCEIVRDLGQGLEFYNNLATILARFGANCRDWVRARREELRAYAQTSGNNEYDVEYTSTPSPQTESPLSSSSPSPASLPQRLPTASSQHLNSANKPDSVPITGTGGAGAIQIQEDIQNVSAGVGASRKNEVPTAPAAPIRMSAPVPAMNLPPPDSDEWEDTPMPSLSPRTPGGKLPPMKTSRKF